MAHARALASATESRLAPASTSRRAGLRLAPALIAAALALPFAATGAAAADNPFTQLAGDWTGGGTITPTHSQPVKVTCKVDYVVSGDKATQTLACTGPDYKFDATMKLRYGNGRVKGSWSNVTYDAEGGVIGHADDSQIHARISGDKFDGRMSINMSGKRHTINITELDPRTNHYVGVANLTLTR